MPGGFNFRPLLHKIRGVKLGKNVWISQYVYIDELHPEAIEIGDNCTIGLRCSIFSHLYWGPRKTGHGFKKVIIEKNVYIGPHCLILAAGVKVGEGAVVKGGSVLSRNVPPRSFWGPASSGPLGTVTVPFTKGCTYDEFLRGLKPIRKSTSQPPALEN